MTVGATGPGLDVFANGRQIHARRTPRRRDESLPGNLAHLRSGVAPTDTDLVLAVRTLYIPFGSYAYTSFFPERNGSASATRRICSDLGTSGPRTACLSACRGWSMPSCFTVLALFLLALYFTQKGHVEYLWLALHELVQAPIGFIDLAGSLARTRSALVRRDDPAACRHFGLSLLRVSGRLPVAARAMVYHGCCARPRRFLLGVGPGMLLLWEP